MGKDLIPVAREYDTSILNIDPTILGKKLYEAAFPSWKRATIEIASLEQMKAQGQKRTRADVRRYIHEKIGGIMKHHAVIGKILSEYCPESPTCTEYNALGHKLPSKGLLDEADKIISFRLHPDRFPHDPEQQKLATNILFETKGAIEFLRNPDKESRKLHEVIIKATENNPKTAAKIGAIFAEAKGQKGVQSEIPKSAGKLKGRTALIATGVVLSALAVYAAYKTLQGRDKKKSNDGKDEENKQLRDKLTAQEAQTEHPQKSFVAAEDLRRASSKQQTSAGVPSVA